MLAVLASRVIQNMPKICNNRNYLIVRTVRFLMQPLSFMSMVGHERSGSPSFTCSPMCEKMQVECFPGDRFGGYARERLPQGFLRLRRIPAVGHPQVPHTALPVLPPLDNNQSPTRRQIPLRDCSSPLSRKRSTRNPRPPGHLPHDFVTPLRFLASHQSHPRKYGENHGDP